MEVAAPDDPDAMLAAAHVAFRRGRHDDAIQRLERLLDMNERNVAVRGLLIEVYLAAGNKERASRHLRVFHALGGVPDLLWG